MPRSNPGDGTSGREEGWAQALRCEEQQGVTGDRTTGATCLKDDERETRMGHPDVWSCEAWALFSGTEESMEILPWG